MTFDSQHHDITRCHIRPWLSWGFTELAFGGLMVNCDLLKSSTHLFTEAGTTQKKQKKKHDLALLETYCICKNYAYHAYHIDLHARCIAMRRDTLELFWKFVFCLSSLEPAKYNLVSKFYGDNMWKIIWGALTSVLGFTEKIDPPIISKAPRLWFSNSCQNIRAKRTRSFMSPKTTPPKQSRFTVIYRKPIDQFDNTSRKTPPTEAVEIVQHDSTELTKNWRYEYGETQCESRWVSQNRWVKVTRRTLPA